MSDKRMMLKPFSVRYLIGGFVCATGSGLNCFLLLAITLTIRSSTFDRFTNVQLRSYLERNKKGLKGLLKVRKRYERSIDVLERGSGYTLQADCENERKSRTAFYRATPAESPARKR